MLITVNIIIYEKYLFCIFIYTFFPFQIIFAFLGLVFSCALAADDAVKNHRLEKRQDDSYLFFGGWQPLKTSASDTYRASATGRYHDLISAIPGSADAVARYYTHALPSASNYYKDIYNYYPRPAIKNAPKKNTPVYMERLKPQRQQPKRGGKGSKSSGGTPQFIDIQKLELNHLRELQNVLLQAKELPLTKLNLPNLQSYGGKQYEIVEVAVQPLQQSSYNTGPRNTNRYNRNRGAQRNNKGSYRRVPQNIKPSQLPLQFQYISVPKIKTLPAQILPKQIPLTPIKIPQVIPAIDDIINLKNIQVVEVPAPSAVPISISSGKISVGSQYGKRNNGYSQQQYRIPSPKSSQKVSFPANTYYSHNSEQPRQHYSAPSSSKSNYGAQQQAQIEAELVKLSEEDVQELLKNLQIVQQNSQDFLKIIPLAEAAHKMKSEQVQLVLTLPPGIQEQNVETSSYGSQNEGKETSYSSKEPYVAIPQDTAYPSQDSASISYNSGGYQLSTHSQGAEHSASGYQIDEQGRSPYEQYQTLDGKAGYIRKPYEEVRSTKTRESAYDQAGYDAPAKQQGGHGHSQQYLEIMTPPADASGYKREPVLAVEIQKGQSIEDAIKAIDPETLQRLGAHGKDGLEIELVEVPVEEYAESKKAETYVSSTNSTTSASKTTTAAPAQKAKTTTTEKKS